MMTQSSLPIPRHSRRANRRAFTIVELLTVIGILALLTTITVVSMKAVGGNANEKDTRARLERLRNALGDITNTSEGRTRLQQVIIPQLFVASDNTPWAAVPASSENSVFKTGQLIKILSSNAAFRKAIDDLPVKSKQNIVFNLRDNGANNRMWTPADPAPPKPLNANNHVELTLPLDAWGNPIVFVFDGWVDPATRARRVTGNGRDTGGLTEIYSETAEQFWRFGDVGDRPVITDRAVSPFDRFASSHGSYNVKADALRNDADRGSFWFSAGKDGKYESHDDNLYSFEGN